MPPLLDKVTSVTSVTTVTTVASGTVTTVTPSISNYICHIVASGLHSYISTTFASLMGRNIHECPSCNYMTYIMIILWLSSYFMICCCLIIFVFIIFIQVHSLSLSIYTK